MGKKVDLLIENLKELVTPGTSRLPVKGARMRDLEVVKGVSIVVDGEKIAGITREPNEYDPALRVDGSQLVALPGFVDAHTHLPFYAFRYEEFLMRAEGKEYMEILKAGGGIYGTVSEVRKVSLHEMVHFNRRFLDSMFRKGVTTCETKSGYGLNEEGEIKQLECVKILNETHPIDLIPTFLGAHVVDKEYRSRTREYLEHLLSFSEKIKKYTNTVDIFCEKDVFELEDTRYYLHEMRKRGFRLRLHANEFEDMGCAKLGVELGAVSVDHLLVCSTATLDALASSNTVAVLMPGTSFFMNKDYAPARKIIDEGGAVALGSDFNPGSCMIYDPTLIIHLAVNHLKMKVEEAITAYTINSAYVLGIAEKLGSLEKGKQADILLLDIPSYRALPYVPGHDVVRAVIKKGKCYTQSTSLYLS